VSDTIQAIGFRPIALSADEHALVDTVREFARAARFPPSAQSPTRGGFDRAFSAMLGQQGWAGMTIPKAYGGSERSGVERCLVISELLAAGAPLGAHWTADRQTAPSILRNGPEALRRRLLPEIAAGRCLMAGGFSEPDAGSDLAAVRTRAERVDGGWRITGRKIWTTDADRADYIEILCRTSESQRKHEGLSLIVVPMNAEGVSVHPIEGMDGERHFNEVVIDNVFAPSDWLIGEEGSGWRQLTAELALERAGPERYLSTFPLFEAFVRSRELSARPEDAHELIGSTIAQQMGLRIMSLSIARMVDEGGSPVAEAAMTKDLGTELEQLLVDQLWRYRTDALRPGPARDRFYEFLDINRLRSPVFTTAGGTNEVLRMLVGRQLGNWAASRRAWAFDSPASEAVFDQANAAYEGAGDRSVPRGDVDPISVELLQQLRRDGFLGVGVDETWGGSGGSLADAFDVVRGVTYAGSSAPVVEGPLLAGFLLSRAGIAFAWDSELAVIATGEVTAGPADRGQVRLHGELVDVGWAHQASALVVPVQRDGGLHVAVVRTADLDLGECVGDAAGDPVARSIPLAGTPAQLADSSLDTASAMEILRHRAALGTAARLSAALQRSAQLTVDFANTRVQFGQPIARFQAVQTFLVRLASEAQRVAVLVDAALAAAGEADDLARAFDVIAGARTLAGEAAIVSARVAHQVHGAIGVTMEYPLQRYTRRLWQLSLADGGTESWARAVGARACRTELGAWELITSAG
jgi:alkylation response protein AidB-like acyl-CoA dehydrogenase